MRKNIFGFQVAYFRREYNLSQEELAEMLDCSPSTISRIENGVEYPRKKLFEKFNAAFEDFGISYEELPLEESFELLRAKEKLLRALHDGREELLEEAMEKFIELMDENNIEHQQYCMLGQLICRRRNGLPNRVFLDMCKDLYERRRPFPNPEDLPRLHLNKIEHMIIFRYALDLHIIGDNQMAGAYLEGLMQNSFSHKTEYQRNRCESLSMNIAKIMVVQNDLLRAQKCLGYTFKSISENFDTMLLLHSLHVQKELFGSIGDFEGQEIIDEFLETSVKMMSYIHCHMKEVA